MWGRDDGNFFASDPGAEGDKGIHVGYEYGDTFFAAETEARIRWDTTWRASTAPQTTAEFLKAWA